MNEMRLCRPCVAHLCSTCCCCCCLLRDDVAAALRVPADSLELSMGMSGDFEQAVSSRRQQQAWRGQGQCWAAGCNSQKTATSTAELALKQQSKQGAAQQAGGAGVVGVNVLCAVAVVSGGYCLVRCLPQLTSALADYVVPPHAGSLCYVRCCHSSQGAGGGGAVFVLN
jgi:hypothetical protein